jgi:hypothetical protein
MLSFALDRILSRAKSPLTCRELVRQVYLQYNAWHRQSPTPLVEGGDQDKFFLDEGTAQRSPFVLIKADDGMRVDAGSIQGVADGTVFAVYPPAGGGGEPVGHVKISEGGTGLLDSSVEATEYPAGQSAVPVDRLPHGGECRIVVHTYPSVSIPVGVEADSSGGPPDAASSQEVGRLRGILGEIAARKAAPIEVVDPAEVELNPGRTAFLIRVERDRRSVLVPTPSLANSGETSKPPVRYGPIDAGAATAQWLEQRLGRIARAQSFIDVIRDLPPADVKAQVLLYQPLRKADGSLARDARKLVRPLLKDGKPVLERILETTETVELHQDDLVAFRLKNVGTETLHVTLTFANINYGLSTVFPPQNTTDNILLPGREIDTVIKNYGVDIEGIERIALIAVRSRPEQPIDFSLFDQPSLEIARSRAIGNTRSLRGLESPLGRLLQDVMFKGQRGSFGDVEFGSVAGRLVTVRSIKAPRESQP